MGKGLWLTEEAYMKLTKARLGVKCDYCINIENATQASPRHKYKFCPMCGRYREFVNNGGSKKSNQKGVK